MESRRQFSRVWESLKSVYPLRFQPYRNDMVPDFLEKLMAWLSQFDEDDQATAFLLAARMVFITEKQFEFLQRRLFQSQIRHFLLQSVISRYGYAQQDYFRAVKHLDEEME